MPRPKKRIKVSYRKELERYQICYIWNPGHWIITPYKTPEEAVQWASEREQLYKKTGGNNKSRDIANPTFGTIAEGFYDKDSHFRKMKAKKNREYLEDFYLKRSGLLKNHILPYFRNYKITEITPYEIDAWVIKLKLAADTKNKTLEVFKEIMQSACAQKILSSNPLADVEKFGNDSKERIPFTSEEINKIFPSDLKRALLVWESPLYLLWGIVLRDTGCRPSEALAWTWTDYSEQWGGFPIVKRVRGYSGVSYPGTKGGKTQFRAAILSEFGNMLLKTLRETCTTERVFPFRVDQGNAYFLFALARAQVPQKGRTQYCLRHTAVTQTIDIDRALAAEMYGHKTVKHQNNYDHPNVEELFQRVSGATEVLRKRLDDK